MTYLLALVERVPVTYLLALFERVEHFEDVRMSEANHRLHLGPQQVGDRLSSLRFVQFLSDLLIEDEDGHLLENAAIDRDVSW